MLRIPLQSLLFTWNEKQPVSCNLAPNTDQILFQNVVFGVTGWGKEDIAAVSPISFVLLRRLHLQTAVKMEVC